MVVIITTNLSNRNLDLHVQLRHHHMVMVMVIIIIILLVVYHLEQGFGLLYSIAFNSKP